MGRRCSGEGPSFGSTMMVPVSVFEPPPVMAVSIRLWLPVMVSGAMLATSPPEGLLAAIVLFSVAVPELWMLPPSAAAELPDRVQLVSVTVAPPILSMPPPLSWAELSDRVQLVNVNVPPSSLSMPPPSLPLLREPCVLLPDRVQLVSVAVP